MKLVKEKLSLIQRLEMLFYSLDWLTTTFIPEFDIDTNEWTIQHFPWKERIRCCLSGIETAILGYVYRVVDDD